MTMRMTDGTSKASASETLDAWGARLRTRHRDGEPAPALLLAAFFAGELIYQGLEYTTAASGALFVYTAPLVVALGAHALVLGERRPPDPQSLGRPRRSRGAPR
jgi:hypothetical protein